MGSCQRILRGRATKCKSVVAGIKNLYLVPFGSLGTVTLDQWKRIQSFTGTAYAFKFEVYKDATLTQNVMSSFNNGTTFVTQTLDVTLKQIDYVTDDMMMDFAWSKYHIIVEDNNGDFMFLGYEFGYNSVSIDSVTGKVMTDFIGYNLVFNFEEKRLANQLVGSLEDLGFNIIDNPYEYSVILFGERVVVDGGEFDAEGCILGDLEDLNSN